MMWDGASRGGAVAGKEIPLVVMSHQLHQAASSSSSNTTTATPSTLGGQGSIKGGNMKGYSTSVSSSFQPRSEQDKNTRNRPFGAPVSWAQFFYVDKVQGLALPTQPNPKLFKLFYSKLKVLHANPNPTILYPNPTLT